MDLPAPPDDLDLKNIIDKLANFVARNGPEFEQMTKQKQKDNPKFSFLFGGENFKYYQFKVSSEQSNISQQNLAQHQALAQQSIGQLSLVSPAIAPPTLIQPPPIGQPPPVQPASGPSVIVQPGTILQNSPWQQTVPIPQQMQVLQQQQQSAAQEQLTQGLIQQTMQEQIAKGELTIAARYQTLLQQQKQSVEEQIHQSEQNLAAQYRSLIQQQQVQIEDAILEARDEKLFNLAQKSELSLEDLDRVVQPIIDSCTKDAILNGKSWIFNHCNTDACCELISQYILKRVTTKDVGFQLKLHLIYLINDLLHHCQRKNVENLKKELEAIVIPAFCSAGAGVEEEKRMKLTKLLNIWEANSYFDPSTIEEIKNPAEALANFQANLITEFAHVVTKVTAMTQQKYVPLQNQHQDFVAHLNSQVSALQQTLQIPNPPSTSESSPSPGPQPTVVQLPPVQLIHPTVAVAESIVTLGPPRMSSPAPPGIVTSLPDPILLEQLPTTSSPGNIAATSGFSQPTDMASIGPPGVAIPPFGPPFNAPPTQLGSAPQFPAFIQPPGFAGLPPPISSVPLPLDVDYGPPPASQIPLPDFSKPPPGFPVGPPSEAPAAVPNDFDLTPSVPYFELPAGLMAPLVKLEETEYKSLNPKLIRLPPPMPPSHRLLAAVEAFYSAPSRDRPRDSEGWEKLGLYEFFKAKQKAKKNQDRENEGRSPRSRSRSPSVSRSPSPSPSPPPARRRRRSPESRFQSRAMSPSQGRSASPCPYQRSSRSPSPVRPRGHAPYQRLSRSPSPSRPYRPPYPYQRSSRSPSPRPYQPGSRSPSPGGKQSQLPYQAQSPSHSSFPYKQSSRSPSPTYPSRTPPLTRSPTPPMVSFGSEMPAFSADSRLGEDNKGHQLLKKMGWGGKGLGATEQGRVDPIQEGDVRDRQDKFKGIGIDLKDPFEQFRKNKSKGFVQRMRAREEMRETVRHKKDDQEEPEEKPAS